MREALNSLGLAGVLTHDPHRGFFLTKYSQAEIAQLYWVRGVLEVELVRALEWPSATEMRTLKKMAVVMQDAAKAGEAGGAMLGWPGSKVARGRVRCAVAPNGAPDCVEAANALCRSKGYGPGKSRDVNTVNKCPTWVWLSGQPAPEGTCTTETFVLQAACQ